jgi:hypothetical protein
VGSGNSNYSPPSGGGALDTINRITIGDKAVTSGDNEVRGSIQDFVVWNTPLTDEDAAILYNSGSWLDIHSHPSASSIWDWWEFSGSTSGSSLDTNGITEVVPTIGRHTLDIHSHASGTVFVTDGIIESSKDAATWRSHVASKIEAATNYSASVASNTINMHQTSSAVISDSLTNSNNTFTNEVAFGLDRTNYVYVSGAVSGNNLQIEDEVFIVSTASSPSTWASGSGGILVNSTGSEFWNYLSGAIEQYLPEYTASYFVYDNQANFFIRNSASSDKANDTLTESGDTFSNLHLATGSAASGSSNLTDGDTLVLDGDTFTIRYTTTGSAPPSTDFCVGTSYRNAFNWKAISSGGYRMSLYNTGYTNPGSDTVAFSFWVNFDHDDGGNSQYIIQTADASGNSGLFISRKDLDMQVVIYDTSGDYKTYATTSDSLPTGEWLLITIQIDRSDVETSPVMYINNQLKSFSSDGSGTGASREIRKIWIGDVSVYSDANELQGSMQDFVVWNTGINSEDHRILYNSGSWLDIHSHPSASSIWDWWLFGSEDPTDASGSTLAANSIASVQPEIGRHSLVPAPEGGASIFITTGIIENKNTNSGFKSHIASVIQNQTAFSASVSSVLLEITAATDVHSTGSFEETGSTFTLGSGIEFVKYGAYHSGAYSNLQSTYNEPEYGIKIQDKTFWVSGSTTPSQPYTTVGDNIFVYSHQDNDITWWNYLSSAIENTFPDYTVSYIEHSNQAQFLVRSGSEGVPGNTIYQIGENNSGAEGISFSATGESALNPFKDIHMATGSVTSGSSTLSEFDTLRIVDNTGGFNVEARHTTSGSFTGAINTAGTYRKAFNFHVPTYDAMRTSVENTSYTNPTSNNIAFSFWLKADSVNNSQYPRTIMQFHDSSDNVALAIHRHSGSILMRQFSGTGATNFRQFTSSVGNISAFAYQHYTITIDTTNVQTVPIVYRNGILDSMEANSTAIDYPSQNPLVQDGSGGLIDLQKIYIGDENGTSVAGFSLKGAIQDVVVWNTGLTSVDAKALYNSGSWFDIHSHPSASYIWDWWMLGEEDGIPAVNNPLSAPNFPLPPAIGRHDLSAGTNLVGFVHVAGGIKNIGKTNAEFWGEVAQSIIDNTEFDQSHISTSGVIYQLTASTVITSSMMLQETILVDDPRGTNQAAFEAYGVGTFGVSPVVRGPEVLTQQRYVGGGATSGNEFAIRPNFEESDKIRFIIDASGGVASTSAPYYTKDGSGNYHIFSSASSDDEFWLRISGAITDAYPGYAINSSSHGLGSYPGRTVFNITGAQTEDVCSETDIYHVHNRDVELTGTYGGGPEAWTFSGSFTTESDNSSQVFDIDGGLDQVIECALINVVERESDFLTGSTRNKTVITSRFSAPGGVEVQTYGYLDAYAREYSVHNSLNYRNLSVRGSGSGEEGTLRVNSQVGTRDGLRTLYQRSMGLGGTDSVHGPGTDSSDYEYSASFHKVPRNTLVRPGGNKSRALEFYDTQPDATVDSKLRAINLTGFPDNKAISVSTWVKVPSRSKLSDSGVSEIQNFYIFDFEDQASVEDEANHYSTLQLYVSSSGIYSSIYGNGDQETLYGWTWTYLGIEKEDLFDWSHLVITWPGSPSEKPTIYFNNRAGITGSIVVAGGGDSESVQDEFGNLQEFCIWSGSLDSTDVDEIYNYGRYFNLQNANKSSTIIDYYRFGEELTGVSSGSVLPHGTEFIPVIGSNVLKTQGVVIINSGFHDEGFSYVEKRNNYNFNSVLPSSDYNYSWVTSSLGNNYSVRSGTQKVFGYWPRKGIHSSSAGFDSAITFPSASEISGV